jgi:hypothetical protein
MSVDVSKGFGQLQADFAHCTMINITNNHHVKNQFHRMEEKGDHWTHLLLRRTNRRLRD